MNKTISNGYLRTLEVLPNSIKMQSEGESRLEIIMALASFNKKDLLNAMAEIWTDEFKEVMEEFDERFKKYYYKLPQAFGNSFHNYLNENLSPTPGVEHKYFIDTATGYKNIKTKFTRQEFAKIVEEFPEYSIMVEEEIKEAN